MATELLPKEVSRIIYLDCDIVLNADIKHIWEIDINNYLLAAVRDKLYKDYKDTYFNSGFMFLNLKELRDFDFYNKWKNYSKTHPNIFELKFGDQDILNAVTEDRIMFLSEDYNCYNSKLFSDKTIVVHFGGSKPWEPTCLHPRTFKEIYWKYTDQNPWRINSKSEKAKAYVKYIIKFLRKQPLFFLKKKYYSRILDVIYCKITSRNK